MSQDSNILSSVAGSYAYVKLRETLVVSEATRNSMRANRASETSPEVRLRRALWAAGIRGYRKNVRKLPGAPDLVFARAKLAVFVHGCYWHSCPKCMGGRIPKTNSAYWTVKLRRNRERDEENTRKLAEAGFQVMVLWECELKGDGLAEAVTRISSALQSTG